MSFVYKMSIQKQLNSCDVVICILIYFKYRYSLWQLLCRLLFLFLFFSKYSLWQLSFRLLFFLFLFFSKDILWQLSFRLMFIFIFILFKGQSVTAVMSLAVFIFILFEGQSMTAVLSQWRSVTIFNVAFLYCRYLLYGYIMRFWL